MPDITMCVNDDCPLRETCYRYMAEPSTAQSMAKYEWKDDGQWAWCEYHLDIPN